jgi:hypothetical protein
MFTQKKEVSLVKYIGLAKERSLANKIYRFSQEIKV